MASRKKLGPMSQAFFFWIVLPLLPVTADSPSLPSELELDGLVTPGRRLALPALVTGSVTQVPVRIGQTIEEGETLFQMDETEARLAAAEAEGAEKVARAKLLAAQTSIGRATLARELAASDLRRAETSRERVSDSVTDAELERRRMLLNQTQADLEIAEQQAQVAQGELDVAKIRRETAQSRLERHQLQAPFRGQVSRLVARPGEWIEVGQTAVEIIDTQTIHIVTFLSSDMRELWKEDLAVEIRCETSTDVQIGHPFSVAAEIDPATGKLLAILRVEAPGKLIPGERVRLRFADSASEPASQP